MGKRRNRRKKNVTHATPSWTEEVPSRAPSHHPMTNEDFRKMFITSRAPASSATPSVTEEVPSHAPSKNTFIENKSSNLQEQNDCKRKRNEELKIDSSINNCSKILISKKNESICQKPEHYKISEIKNHTDSNDRISQNRPAIKFSSSRLASTTIRPKEMYSASLSANVNQDAHVSIMSGVRPKYGTQHVVSEPDGYRSYSDFISSLSNCSESDDEYTDLYKPVFDYPYEERNSEQEFKLKGMKVKDNFFSSVNEYKSSKDSFLDIYHKWLPERRGTLEKLQSLRREVYSEELKYNEAQAGFKEFSFMSRAAIRETDNGAVNFLASFAAFVSDAASGITSFAQAFKVDSYQTKFLEIMDHDAEITKDLYESRSRCVTEYQGIEEVMRNFHSDTFSSTVGQVSDTLQVNKYWESMKNAYRNDDMSKLVETACKFFDNACQSDVLGQVGDSIGRYCNDNPATVEACKSTCKALYGAVNTWAPKCPRNSTVSKLNYAANTYLMIEDKKDAEYLKHIISEDCSPSKFNSQIKDAIDSLQSEMEEINDAYCELFKKNIYEVEYDSE